MPLTVAVFDLDDTLVLERDYVRSGFRAVGEHVRRDSVSSASSTSAGSSSSAHGGTSSTRR